MIGTARGLFVISGLSLVVALVLVALVLTKRADIMDVNTTVKANMSRISHVEQLMTETRAEHAERLAAQMRIADAAEKTAATVAKVAAGVAQTALETRKTACETRKTARETAAIAKRNEVYQKKVIELLEREAD